MIGYIAKNTNRFTITMASRRYNDWNCKKCGFLVFGSKDRCFKCNLGKDGKPVNNKTKKFKPDWNCKKCGFLVFGSKDKCFKCGTLKDNTTNKPMNLRPGDWVCDKCGMLVFGSRKGCFKCKIDKNGNSIIKDETKSNSGETTSDDEYDDTTCVVCLSNKKELTFVHGGIGHKACCNECYNAIKAHDNKCPICRELIESTIVTISC